ncbi:MAG TPA: hypothetical protein VK648_12195 [Gemmatimonadaceae bacterium]|nr:MAG: hypothetical protein DMF56_25005 [Acidobacteriota bacterium]HTD84536.1 hypothetical protein [Gemmatimonadaceae bacterium]
MRIQFLALIVLLLPLTLSAQSHTIGDFHGCSSAGDAGLDHPSADPALNELKNRDVAPAAYLSKSVTAIISDTAPRAMQAGEQKREDWSPAQRDSIAAREDTGIVVIGYLAGVKKEDKESCNCHDAAHVDYHLWLVQSPGQKRSKSMVIEISPRMLDDHPDWPTLATTAWHKGHHVRISGWRTWDQEHHEQLTDRTNHNGTVTHASRATLWEIHPIHRIEVQAEDGSWVDIEEIDL